MQNKFPTKLFIITALANLIILAGLFVLYEIRLSARSSELENNAGAKYFSNKDNVSTDPMLTVVPQVKDLIDAPIIDNIDPSLGEESAKVNLVQFSDFECAYCQNQEKILKQIVADYKGKVRLIWKDFPETDVNSVSWQASIAGRCAQEQGKFWEYHDALFGSSGKLNEEKYLELAKGLNLNVNIFADCLKDEEIAVLVEDNIIEADALEITGIPFIFVNEKALFGEVTYEELKQLVEAELK